MTTWRRLAILITCALALLGVAAPTAQAQNPPGPPSGRGGPPAGGGASGGGAPAGEPEVHSWALTPAVPEGSDPAGARPYLSYELAPGATVEDAVTIFNYGNVQLTFRIYGTDARNNEDGEFDLLPGEDSPTDAGSWITLPQANITVPAQSQATLPISIRVPADARPGDHAAAILASSQAVGTGPDGKSIVTDRRTGSRVYVRVAGPLSPELGIEDVETTYTHSPNPLGGRAEVLYTIVNRGNVRMSATHHVGVSGLLGLGRASSDPEEISELLPGERVTIHATLDGVPAGGIAFTDVDLESRPVGDDSAEATASQSARAKTFAPPLSVLALAAVLVLVLTARRAYVRHRGGAVSINPQGT